MSVLYLKIWIMACRPKTLPAAVAPVAIGTAMAYGDGVNHFLSAFICFFCALMIQIGTNLSNDYYDFKKGADTPERIGPIRVTQTGLIRPSLVKISFILVFGIAVLSSFYLVYRGGWSIVVIGTVSIVSGLLYTGGPRPLGYVGLGEIFVLLFFGPVAVAGTYYVQALRWDFSSVLAGFAVGFLSVAMLVVNNLRDIEGDRKAGKLTLAVRFGRTFAAYEYVFSILFAAIIPIFIYLYVCEHILILPSVLILIVAIPAIRKVFTKTDGISLNNVLVFTGRILLIYSIIFSVGWIL